MIAMGGGLFCDRPDEWCFGCLGDGRSCKVQV